MRSIVRSDTELLQSEGNAVSLIYNKFIHYLRIEAANLFVWSPVFVGIGIGIFYSQPSEPSWFLVIGLFVVLVLLLIILWLIGRWRHVFLISILCLIAVGIFSAKVRLVTVNAPFLTEKTGPLIIRGQVSRVENRSQRGIRIYINPYEIRLAENEASIETQQWPKHIRVSVRPKLSKVRDTGQSYNPNAYFGTKLGLQQPVVGSYTEVKAVLFPPPEPVIPGGYDFGRRAYFQQLGAVGYVLEPPRVICPDAFHQGTKVNVGLPLSSDRSRTADLADLSHFPGGNIFSEVFYKIERLRQFISIRVRSALESRAGGLADALITGNRSGIDEPEISNLRKAGLAHILAISGLHMAIVTGTLFWWLRAVLALVPSLACYLDIKKVSAILSLIGAGYYLFLSGASVATERAFIMITILFIGIIVDRPCLTLRNVAAAAIMILLFRPESLADVGFQMSFAAAAALVSTYEFFRKLNFNFREKIRSGILYKVVGYFSGISLSTLIASLAVAPFAVYHFHHLTQYGLVANLVALPVLAMLIMPAAIMTLLSLPFGLENIPLTVMSFGCEIILDVARTVSSWTHSQITFRQWSTREFLIVVCGGIWIVLCQTGIRLLAVPAVVVGLIVIGPADGSLRPQVLIERDGRIVAIRDQNGLLATPEIDRGRYTLTKWLEAEGDTRPITLVQNRELFPCDWSRCRAEIGGYRLTLVKSRRALAEVCRYSDIVIAPFNISGPCGTKLLIDKALLRKEGAHAIYFVGSSKREYKNSNDIEIPRKQLSSTRQSVFEPSDTSFSQDLKIVTVRERRGNWPWNR